MPPCYQCARLRLNGASGGLRVIVGDPGNHHPIFSLPRFADVDATLEEGAITNADGGPVRKRTIEHAKTAWMVK